MKISDFSKKWLCSIVSVTFIITLACFTNVGLFRPGIAQAYSVSQVSTTGATSVAPYSVKIGSTSNFYTFPQKNGANPAEYYYGQIANVSYEYTISSTGEKWLLVELTDGTCNWVTQESTVPAALVYKNDQASLFSNPDIDSFVNSGAAYTGQIANIEQTVIAINGWTWYHLTFGDGKNYWATDYYGTFKKAVSISTSALVYKNDQASLFSNPTDDSFLSTGGSYTGQIANIEQTVIAINGWTWYHLIFGDGKSYWATDYFGDFARTKTILTSALIYKNDQASLFSNSDSNTFISNGEEYTGQPAKVQQAIMARDDWVWYYLTFEDGRSYWVTDHYGAFAKTNSIIVSKNPLATPQYIPTHNYGKALGWTNSVGSNIYYPISCSPITKTRVVYYTIDVAADVYNPEINTAINEWNSEFDVNVFVPVSQAPENSAVLNIKNGTIDGLGNTIATTTSPNNGNGSIYIDNVDFGLESSAVRVDTLEHELGHVLGLSMDDEVTNPNPIAAANHDVMLMLDVPFVSYSISDEDVYYALKYTLNR